MRGGITAVVVALVALWPAAGWSQAPRLEDVLARAETYVRDFVTRFSNVVAEERSTYRLILERRNRTLISDFLLVQLPGTLDWLAFRDVFEVDGKPVRDRDERLTKLFLEGSGTAVQRAREITAEGARYNFREVSALNNPLLAIAILQSRYQSRFRWSAAWRFGAAPRS